MKKPDITKGEWFRNKEHKTVVSHDKHNMEIIICEIDYIGTDKEEEMANAKAISAVPEMIDALISVKELFDILKVYSENAKEAGKMIDKINNALTKAGVTDL